MAATLKSFSLVMLLVIISVFVAWFYLSNKGLSRPHIAFQDGFFGAKESQLLIALRGESFEFPEDSLPAFEAAAALDPQVILWADVMLSKDGVPVVTRHQDLAIYGVENSFVPLLNFEQIQKVDSGYSYQNQKQEHPFRGKALHILELSQLLKKFPKHRFIINLADDSTGMEQQLVKALEYNDQTKRFIITSERDKVLKETRKLAPMLLYGASTPQLTQLMILANVFLASIAPLDSDLLIVENTSERVRNSLRIHINEQMIQEAHRRSLKVFAGNAQNASDAADLIKLGADGIITNHPTALKDFFEKHDFGR